MNRPKVVAEIGCNHQGEFSKALLLIKKAKECGADYAKFQKRNAKELFTEEEYKRPHPEPRNSFGDSYGEHREALEFPIELHHDLKDYCESIGIEYACSVWDTTSAREIASLNPKYIKIPSAMNSCWQIYDALHDYQGQIHVSLGMTTLEEEQRIIEYFASKNMLTRLVLYHCTSGYPVPFEQIALFEITRLKTYGNEIGFSGHHLGIAVDIAAMMLGVSWIERHFTIDRTWKGTDHAASLEPAGLHKLVRNIDAVMLSLTEKKGKILPIEAPQRAKLRKVTLPCMAQ